MPLGILALMGLGAGVTWGGPPLLSYLYTQQQQQRPPEVHGLSDEALLYTAVAIGGLALVLAVKR